MTLAEKFISIDNQIRALELKQKGHEEEEVIAFLKEIENGLIQTYQKQGSWF